MTDKPIAEPRPNTYESPFGQESAPSALRDDQPSFARFCGMAGLLLVFATAFIFLFNAWIGPRWLTPIWGFIFLVAGLAALLYHATRETEIQIRRSYGVFGLGLIALSIALGLFTLKENTAGIPFLGWSAVCGLLGLFFTLTFAHVENDPFWRRISVGALTLVGGAAAVGGLVGGSISSGFLLNPGLLLVLFDLLYVWSAVGLLGAGSDGGYKLAAAFGALGLVVFLVAAARSLAPMLGMTTTRYFLPAGMLLMFAGALCFVLALSLVSDNRLIVLTRRELASFFFSPIAYIVLFGLTIVGWWTYFRFSGYLFLAARDQEPMTEPIVRLFFIDFFPVMCAIFVVPVVTMKLLSEERRTGTLEVLLTAPVDESMVVLSKFFAGLLYYLFLWLPWGLFLLALRLEGGRDFDYRPLLSFAVVLVATGAAFISMGVFFSALTRNQIIAAVMTFVGMMVLLGLYFIKNQLGQDWQAVVNQVGFVDIWIESLSGKLFLRTVLVQLSMTVFWLFLAVKALEARKWS